MDELASLPPMPSMPPPEGCPSPDPASVSATMVNASASVQALLLDRQFAAIPRVDCGSLNILRTGYSLSAPKELTRAKEEKDAYQEVFDDEVREARTAELGVDTSSPRRAHGKENASLVGSRLQDDAVERAIAQLEMTVQACRGQQHRLVPSPASQAFSAPALHLASELTRDDRRNEPSFADEKSRTDSCDGQNIAPPTPISVRSLSSTISRSDIIDPDDEGPLQAEALTLRTELRRADARLQAAIAEENAIKLVMREGDERHSLRLQELEGAIAKLHKDNSRLERSTQQATLEEQRLADVVRSEPVRTDQMLQRLLTECHRLEKENRRIESDTTAIREELSSVRGVVARDSRRHGPQPRQALPRRGSLRRLQPWT